MSNKTTTAPLLTTENTTDYLNISTTEATTTWNNTSSTTKTTTPTTTLPITTEATTSLTTDHKYPTTETQNDEDSSSQIGPAVGGAIGGVIVIAIVVAIVMVLYRRRKRRNKPKKIPSAPGVDDLDKSNRFERGNSEDGFDNRTFYQNLDEHGRPSEQTDPSLDEDGYMKKTKKKKGKKKKDRENQRKNSIPLHPAPPVPVSNMQDYKDTSGTKKQTKDLVENSNMPVPSEIFSAPPPKAHTGSKEPGYVNSRRKLKATDKHYANVEMTIEVPDQKHYENVNKSSDTNGIDEELYENT